jgi:hypothetical protein
MKRHHRNISISYLTATHTYMTWQPIKCLPFHTRVGIKFQHMVYEKHIFFQPFISQRGP